MSLQLGQIVDTLGGRLENGDRHLQIDAIASLEDAGPQDISFLSNPKLHLQMQASRAGCVAVGSRMEAEARKRFGAYLVVGDPYLFFAQLTQLWRRHHQLRDRQGSVAFRPKLCRRRRISRAHFSVAERALHLGQRQRGQLPRPTLGEQSRRTVQEHPQR